MPVDILLPIGDGAPSVPAMPMVSTISLDPKPEAEKPLDARPRRQPRAEAGDNERAERYEESDFSFRTEVGDKLKKPRR